MVIGSSVSERMYAAAIASYGSPRLARCTPCELTPEQRTVHCLINRQGSHPLGWHRIAALIHKPAHTSIPDGWGQHSTHLALSHLVTRALTTLAQWLKQSGQIVVVKLMHQGQQLPELP